MNTHNNSKKFPRRVYVICSTTKGSKKLHKITDTILEGLPHIKSQEMIGDIPPVYTIPCTIVPYTRYIREVLVDLINNMKLETFYYDMYYYYYTDRSGYHHYKPTQLSYRGTVMLSPTEAVDCLLED
jgi:hypothetical protein